jgi:hypothetical protein
MKKIFLLIIGFLFSLLMLSTLSTLSYSSNPLLVQCEIEAKVLSTGVNELTAQIIRLDPLFQTEECPVNRGDIFEISYTSQREEGSELNKDDSFTAKIGRFWTTPEPGKSSGILNWFDMRDMEDNPILFVNPQSDFFPIDTEDLDHDEGETTIIDENTKEVSNMYFDLTLERRPQSAFTKNIPYILTITPHINSRRTQILWNIPQFLEVNTKHSEFVSLVEGETYTFKANIKPMRGGTYDFSVSVIAWQHDTNYTNTIGDRVQLNNNLVLQPVSQEYQIFNILKFVLIFLLFVGLCALVLIGFSKISPKLKKWLTPPPM